MRCTIVLLRPNRFHSLLQEDLDPIRRPHCNTGSEEIFIFSPNPASQSQRGCQHRPVALVSTAQPLPSLVFTDAVKLMRYRFDDDLKIFEGCRNIGVRQPSLFQQGRQIFPSIIEGNIRREKPGTVACISVDDLPDAASQDCSD